MQKRKGWEMDYDIAISILKNEVNSNKLTYTFELINYLLCYLLNPNELKDGFFLMHGAFLRSIDTASIFSKVEKRRYVVYQSNQELYENYIVRDDDLSDEIKSILVLSGSSYSRPFETTEGGICIFQLDKEK